LTLITFMVTLFGSSSNEHLQSFDNFTSRTTTLKKNRLIMVAITILMSLGFIFGITSSHFQQDGLVITFLVVHLALALVIFLLRVLMDEQVRVNLKRLANRNKEYETTSIRGRSARLSGILSSATSRKSSTNQVAPACGVTPGAGVPVPDEASRITPIEQRTESPTPTTRERPRSITSVSSYVQSSL